MLENIKNNKELMNLTKQYVANNFLGSDEGNPSFDDFIEGKKQDRVYISEEWGDYKDEYIRTRMQEELNDTLIFMEKAIPLLKGDNQ